ncbi:transposase [Meiothermus ruber DSM 1279]|uniref:Transposase n=1 Tax=Meiothermus ruber (strain ATCC 35948 / DSM 1279 / VKM B-1258 / 21) TaxID=504728 RepID=M9XAX5_MEIRD|nr:transposase [Meiothermus ruber DSM 1279]
MTYNILACLEVDERKLARARRRLEGTGSSLPDQKGRPTAKPTLRWVFQLFMWVRLVELGGKLLVLNLASHHETAVRLLGAGRYYLLE